MNCAEVKWFDSDGDGIPWPEDEDEPTNPFLGETGDWGDNDGDGMPNIYDITPDGEDGKWKDGLLPDQEILSANGPEVLRAILEAFVNSLGLAKPPSVDHILDVELTDVNNDGHTTLLEMIAGPILEDLQATVTEYKAEWGGVSPAPAGMADFWSDTSELLNKARLIQLGLSATAPELLETEFGRSLEEIVTDAERIIFELEGFVGTLVLEQLESGPDFLRMTLESAMDVIRRIEAEGGGPVSEGDQQYASLLRSVVEFLTSTAGDPVNTANGAFVYEKTDLQVPGREGSMILSRRYGSRARRRGIVGHNWSMPMLEAFVSIWWGEDQQPQTMVIYWGNGNQGAFRKSPNKPGLYVGVGGEYGKIFLTQTTTGDCQENEPPGLVYRDTKGREYWFCPPSWIGGIGGNSVSWLRAVTDSHGNATLISRDDTGRPVTVTDTLGRETTLEYGWPKGLLQKVTDHEGKETLYTYDTDTGDLLRVDYPDRLFLDSSGTVVSAPVYEEYTYHEDPAGHSQVPGSPLNHNLATISRSGEEAISIEYYGSADLSYDKVESHTVAGKKTRFRYSSIEGSSHPYGSEINFRTDVRYPSGEVESYFHGNGLLYAQERWNGRTDESWNITGDVYTNPDEGVTHAVWLQLYAYDDDYRMTSMEHRTDQLLVGRRVSMTYDDQCPDRFQQRNVLSMTISPDPGDPNGVDLVTTYEYDPLTALPIKSIDPLGRIHEYQRAHQEHSYDDVRNMSSVKDWLILPDPAVNPTRAAELALLFGLGDVNGDGLQENSFEVIRELDPSIEKAAPSGPGGASTHTPERLNRRNDHGQVVAFRDERGIWTNLTYTGGLLTEILTDPGGVGMTERLEYDSSGRVVAQVSRRGGRVEFAHDGAGNTIEVRKKPGLAFGAIGSNSYSSLSGENLNDQDDIVRQLFYDAQGRFCGETEVHYSSSGAAGYGAGLQPDLVSRLQFNADDTVSSFEQLVRDDQGGVETRTWSYAHDGQGRPLSMTTPLGTTTTYVYDSRGLLLSESHEDSSGTALGTWSSDYSPYGDLTHSETPLGHRTSATYDGHGRALTVTSPMGVTTEFSYDLAGRVRTELVAGGAFEARYEYDSLDRVVRTQYHNQRLELNGAITELTPAWIVDENGWGAARGELLWNVVDPGGEGRLTRFEYDALLRRTAVYHGASDDVGVIDSLGAQGHLLSRTLRLDGQGRTGDNPSETTHRFAYDFHGRLRRVVRPDGTTVKHFSSADGLPVETILPDGRTILSTHDSAGQMLQQLETDRGSLSRTSVFDYDSMGNLKSFTDALGRTTTFDYDGLGRLTRRTLPDLWQHRWVYDLDGRVVDERERRNGILISSWPHRVLSWDDDDRLQSIVATGLDADVTRTYSYDALGRPNRITETSLAGTVLVKRVFTSTGALASDQQKRTGNPNRKFSAEVSSLGQVDSLTYPSTSTYTWQRDTLGRPLQVQSGATLIASFSDHYGLSRARTTTLSGGGSLVDVFDSMGRIKRRETRNAASTLLSGEELSYEASTGNVLSRLRLADNVLEEFDYDGLGRLTRWDYDVVGGISARSIDWDWDLVDNATDIADSWALPVQATLNQLNQLTALSPIADTIAYNNSGFEESRTAGGQATSWDWDAFGRPIAYQGFDDNGVPGTLTQTFDGLGRLLYVVHEDGTDSEYSYFGGSLLSEVSGYELTEYVPGYDGSTPLARLSTATGLTYFHVDPTGNVTGLHDGTAPAESYYYEPFGTARNPVDDSLAVGTSGLGNDLYFQAKLANAFSGTSLLGARAYDATLGRFLARDPLGEQAGPNLYSYGHGNPLKWRDPTGLQPQRTQSPGDEVDKVASVTGLMDSRFEGLDDFTASNSALFVINAFLENFEDEPWASGLDSSKPFEEMTFGEQKLILGAFLAMSNEWGGVFPEQEVEMRKWALDGILRLKALESFDTALKFADWGGTIADWAIGQIGDSLDINPELVGDLQLIAGFLSFNKGAKRAATNVAPVVSRNIGKKGVRGTVAAAKDKIKEGFNKLKSKLKRSAPRDVGSGAPKVNAGKQGKHIPGHNNYIEGRSILSADPEALARRAGTGTPVNNVARGEPGFKERVDFGEVIGEYVEDGVGTPTTRGIITYAGDGSIHIIPSRP